MAAPTFSAIAVIIGFSSAAAIPVLPMLTLILVGALKNKAAARK